MASSRSSVDDDSFRERVKKTFGALSFSPSQASPQSNPLWSLTDDEIEKREWRRDHDTRARDSNPCSSSLDELFSRNWSRRSLGGFGDRSDADEWQIRSSIGQDNTLDNEEEDDIDDLVASGRDNAGDRLYMRDVKDSHSRSDKFRSHTASVSAVTRKDPRANRLAAITRLKEDDAAVASTATAISEKSNYTEHPTRASADNTGSSATSNIVKPILKRKGVDKDTCPKPSKRVRFEHSCKVDECGNMDEKASEGVRSNIDNGLLSGLDEKSVSS